MTLHVGLDLDGCFADFQSRWDQRFKPKNAERYTWDVYNGFEKWFTVEEFKAQSDWMGLDGDYGALAMYDHGKDTWDRIAETGAKIHVLTSRPQSAWRSTIEWLNGWRLRYDTLTFTNDKRVVAALAGHHNGRPFNGYFDNVVMLDDYEKHYQQMRGNGIQAWLCDRPWNDHALDIHRVGLKGFADLVEEMAS